MIGAFRLLQRAAWMPLLVVLCVLLWAPASLAQKLETNVAAREVAVGETFTVEVSTEVADGGPRPGQPKLRVKGPAEVHGPSMSTSYQVRMRNFDVQKSQKVVATWSVTPTQVGKLIVGPPSFRFGNQRVQGETVVVDVVKGKPRQNRNRRRPRGRRGPFAQDPFDFDPFDFWRRRGSRNFGLPQAPDKLLLDRAPNPLAFLRAFVDDRRVVVGEPITLEIYAYGSRGAFREMSPKEPSLANFLSYPVVESSHEQARYRVNIDGTDYVVSKLRELIIVPLKTGELEIGSMEAVLRGSGRSYPARGSQFGTKVESDPITIRVTEPPQQGRPDGYLLGDVGRFRLDAQVTPTKVEQGDFVEALVEIEGRGNLPTQVQLPEIEGVMWDEPTVKGGPEVKNGHLSGTRTLKYTVQLNRTGRIDLGNAELPYFNPQTESYGVAKAPLGAVTVEPGQGKSQASEPEDVHQAAPLVPRASFGSFSPKAGLEQPRLFWSTVLGAPLLAALVLLLGRTISWARGRLPRLGRDEIAVALSKAQTASNSNDDAEAARNAERALYLAIENATGKKARAVLRANLAAELRNWEIAPALADELQELLVASERARYGGMEVPVSSLVSRSKKACAELSKLGTRAKKKASRENP